MNDATKTTAELLAERRAKGLHAIDLPQDRGVYMEDLPNIGDTCCGACPGDTCYVDYLTGERS